MAVAPQNDDQLDDMLAALMAPSDSRHLVICRECRTVWPFKRDCKTTKAARDGRATCPKCDDELELTLDAKEEKRDG